MKYVTLLAGMTAVLSGCGPDRVLEIGRADSPDGQVVAVYRQYLYGGAAGGVGHCLTIARTVAANVDCFLLASDLKGLEMCWVGSILEVHYDEATITDFRNHVLVTSESGSGREYEIRLVQKVNNLSGH